jgi:hypothetical protein
MGFHEALCMYFRLQKTACQNSKGPDVPNNPLFAGLATTNFGLFREARP